MKTRFILLTTGLIFLTSLSFAESEHPSPYAGEQHRSIKSLSAADIADLKAGAGWGLAKSAELNGVPGPLHLLEMRDEISLSESQVTQITEVFNQMRSSAKRLGAQLIDQESMLDERFSNNIPATVELRALLNKIGTTRTELRYVHLSAHLKMPEILSEDQIDTYNRIRGYTSTDPCKNVPEGHDESMWRKHNGCG